MKKLFLPIACLLFAEAQAGNVMEMVTLDMSGKLIDSMTFYTESGRSRMDQTGEDGNYSMIFKDDRFVFLDHAQKNYMIMDEAMLTDMAGQINEAMKELQAQLESMPPEQRAMMEEMMKQQMGGMDITATEPVLEIREAGSGSWRDWDCRMTEMLENGTMIQQICSVDFDEVDGSGAVRDEFQRMGRLLGKFFDAIPYAGEGIRNPMELIGEMGGFPVRAVEFEGGTAVRETILESTAEQDIDASRFDMPAGYKKIDPMNP